MARPSDSGLAPVIRALSCAKGMFRLLATCTAARNWPVLRNPAAAVCTLVPAGSRAWARAESVGLVVIRVAAVLVEARDDMPVAGAVFMEDPCDSGERA